MPIDPTARYRGERLVRENPAESRAEARLSTDVVENQIALDREANPLYESRLLNPLRKWWDGVAERIGFYWCIDHCTVFMGGSDSSVNDNASGGKVSFFWDPVNRVGADKGSLNLKNTLSSITVLQIDADQMELVQTIRVA